MAERKLNFNAPLLSTRRMHKTAVSVRRNKTNNFTDVSCVPVLVPEMGLDQVTEAASVPFTWEQAPGRLKGNDFRPQEVSDPTQQVFTPCLPPGKVTDTLKCPVEKAIDGNMSRLQSSKGKQVEEEPEDEDDVFSDARDTLSLKDSITMDQSVSGLSGYGVAETKKALNRSEDRQSRDFMMSRFLPAAKAMTVEQPHYASNRKPSSFMSEPTIQVRDLVPEEKRQASNRYDESIVSPYYYHQDMDDEESEEEDDDEGDEVSEYAKRGCGMLPQLCFKESLGMLNTVPGFKAKHNSPITSSLSHDQEKSSKVAQLKSRFQFVKKLALDSVSKQKLGGKVVHPSVGKKFNSEPNLTSAANRSSSPYRHYRSISPYRSAGNSSSPFHPACFPDTRKETESLRANRLNKHIRNISRSEELLCPKSNGSSSSSLLEKTVYVDTENSPTTNDQQNSNVVITPREADMAGNKPDANLDREAIVKGDELGEINSGPDRCRLAPPSPKKPSESWLLHNMPSATSEITSRRYPFRPQKQDLEENSKNVTKWETIVKTSNMHRDHIRYSEELVAHTSLQ
ncbi:unnamed protein product [Thlaspi arvense]|uniref:Uncharacterized protein n=1 Tax=Thlaspi arvense TaxID=13288 RepID=A0AAU9R5P2_THLAR|nr:unnamed protein product [Thlaspi arvense]